MRDFEYIQFRKCSADFSSLFPHALAEPVGIKGLISSLMSLFEDLSLWSPVLCEAESPQGPVEIFREPLGIMQEIYSYKIDQ